jgi:hypothetical protein
MHKILQGEADGRCQFVEPFDAGADALSGFSQQTLDVQMALLSAGGRFVDTEAWSQPAPEGGRDQELNAPAEETCPVWRVCGPAETGADAPGTLLQNAVSPESLDDDRGSIPAPRVEPVGQAADGMAASETKESSHPDDDPRFFGQASNLAAIQAVANQLQNAVRVSGRFAAEDTELRTKVFDGRGVRTTCAKLLDRDGEAV